MAEETKAQKALHKSKIGGQALIEGVMMKGPLKGAMACRLTDGTIDVEIWEEKNGKNPPWYRRVPLVRGCVNFVQSMKDGYRCLMKSAEKQVEDDDEEEELNRFEQWLTDHLGEKFMKALMVVSALISTVFAFLLFLYLPKWVVGLIDPLTDNHIVRSIAEGIVKIAVFVGYMAVTSCMKDIRRTYEYHGAEHKTIACYEAHLPLTVEHVKKMTRFHPRCGTSFIFIVLIVGIFAACFIPARFVVWQRVLCSLGMLPLVVGISYEFIRLAGRYTNPFTKILSAPGLQLQRITTREPDDKQIEVAIAAITPCIPQDLADDQW